MTQSGSTPDVADWHQQQDEITSKTVADTAADALNREPVFRLWYRAANEHFYNAHLQAIIAGYPRASTIRILDIGCGIGEMTVRLAEIYPDAEVVGIDPNRLSIEQARTRPAPPNATFKEGTFEDARALGQFDLVVCSEVYEHIADPDALLQTIHGVLKPGGHASISTPSGWMWWRPSVLNAYRFAASPREYWRKQLRPEKNWAEALPHHPASRPRVVTRKLEAAGLRVTMQTSSLWHLEEQHGWFYRSMVRWADRSPAIAGRTFFAVYGLLEALLNLVPPLRVFESRRLYWVTRG